MRKLREDALVGCDDKIERETEKERSTKCVRAAVTYWSPSLMGSDDDGEGESLGHGCGDVI